MSANLSPAATGAGSTPAPVSGRAAIAVLGSMVFLIIALMVLLVQSTWVNPASAAATPPALEHDVLGSR